MFRVIPITNKEGSLFGQNLIICQYIANYSESL